MRKRIVGSRRYVLLAIVLAVAVPALWLTVMFVVAPSVAPPSPAGADREALVALYRATDGANWRNSANWLSDAPLDTWHGVTTDESGRVIALALSENALRGTIPTELGNLSYLEELYLSGNRLRGEVPSELGNLFYLTHLYLDGNELSGSIPSELGKLLNLWQLYLFSNELSGEIPAELGKFANLIALNLGSNQLSGEIPAELGHLTNLTWLNLEDNQLRGSIPAELGKLTNLTVLSLSDNGLSGCVPDEVWRNARSNYLDSLDLPVCGAPSAPAAATDREALVAFYQAANGANWRRRYNWLSDGPLDTWYGVTTDDSGRVIRLNLSENWLRGVLPPALGDLTNLTELKLWGNQLSGTIPSELGKLTNLTQLALHSNQLSGEIPPELGKLTNLTQLALHSNQLSGEIPPELGKLTNLTTLRLAGNRLSGAIPSELGNLANLTELDLSSNAFRGSIPAALGRLTNLTTLRLAGNQLSGAIPSELGNLANLEVLLLYGNRLSGSIPTELGNLANLTVLSLSGNELSGTIPSELSNLTSLTTLALGGNQLTGCVPESLRNGASNNLANLGLPLCGDMEVLFKFYQATDGANWLYSGNWLSFEPLDAWHGVTTDASGRVIGLDLAENELSGSIPPELGNLSNLTRLDLDDNRLSGSVPSELGNLTNLETLSLWDNELRGEIPSELGKLNNLTQLYLYSNELSGSIPSELGNLTNLEKLYLSGNGLRGAIPSELGNLANLTELGLSDNRLNGTIPSELGDLTNLEELYLSGNQLSGAIPSELGRLTDLTWLNLWDNQLSGPVPSWLGHLTNLERLFLSDNRFSGCVPGELWRNAGYNDLDSLGLPACGAPSAPAAVTDGAADREAAGALEGSEADSADGESQTAAAPVLPLFTLSEGRTGWEAGEARPPLAQATPLTQEQLQNLLTRLPSLQAESDDIEQTRLPDDLLPPPRPGEEVALPFPPPQSEAAPAGDADTPLRVLRFSPEGEMPPAPQLSVTFNQPMVPLGSHRELAPEDVPVRLSPAIPGDWRWVGTKTLLFEAEAEGVERLPMATQYTVEIPAGTRSASGRELENPVSWTFRTPPPTLQKVHPADGTFAVEPVFFASFDQRIDPAAVIKHAQVTARGRRHALRLASAEEIATDERVRRLAADAQEGRWLAFVSAEPLPSATKVTVTFAAGTPSAEGPLVSSHPQRYGFQTTGTFVLHGYGCVSWGGDMPCQNELALHFSNPLRGTWWSRHGMGYDSTFDPSFISIEPTPDVIEYGPECGYPFMIKPRIASGAPYTVTVAAGLTDRYGQTLAEDVQFQFQWAREASLTAPQRGPITILDPYGAPAFPIYTVNVDAVKVRAYRVAPEQYGEYLEWRNDRREQDPPGELAMERRLEIRGQDGVMMETEIDLADALDGETGHLILHVKPENAPSPALSRWIQVTQIGLDAFVDADGMQVWANSLADGAALSGVNVSLWPQDLHGVTDETGSARLAFPGSSAQLLIARDGDDAAFLPADRYSFRYSGWQRRDEPTEVRYYVFDDRKMYRPGETVSIKGWVRRIERGPDGDVSLLPEGAAPSLEYQVYEGDWGDNLIDSGVIPVNALGGFHFQFDLPENVNLGGARIELRPASGDLDADEASYVHRIQVREFRRPEFEVSARVSAGPHIAGGHALATVSASYFAGGSLPGAAVEWQVKATSASYNPPNWSGFTFGKWSPWWDYDDKSSDLGNASFSSRTGLAGEHSLRIDFPTGETPENGSEPAGAGSVRPFPVHVDAAATVMDVNRQAWSSGAGLLLHAADRYVGLRTDRYFVEQGEPLSVEVVVTDVDGNAIAGHSAVVRAARVDWEYREDGWRAIEKEAQECTVETTAAAAPDDAERKFAACAFDTTLGGAYRISATVVDGAGRRNRTELTRWVSGSQRPPGRGIEQEDVQLIPDGEAYAPGDSAQILVQAPFFPAEGLLTLRREGLVTTERFTMDGPTYTLRVPVEEQYIPNIHVQVDLVGSAARVDDAGNELSSAPRRPAYARGQLNLSVPPLIRTLRVDAAPRVDKLEPGGETTIDVTVADASGAPVAGAEFAVVVVDEAILALTGYQLIDPVSVFYPERERGVDDHHNRADLLLASPESLGGETSTSGNVSRGTYVYNGNAGCAGGGPPWSDAEAIRVRLNYDPLALFAPEVRTDANGRASVAVTLPDSLTRYRVMVVAVAGGRYFGTGESSLTARLPLMARPSAPRFLNFGDSFELPVVLQNRTEEAIETHVVVRATNANLMAENSGSGAAGYAVTVPANDRVEVRFPTTTASPGTARFQFSAVDANNAAVADAAEIDLPVYTPATTEAFAVYGEIDDSGAFLQPLRPPSDAIPSYGGLEVTISSTALQALTDAFIYLLRYPYEHSEQIASRILGVAALRDVLSAFDAEGLPTPDEIESMMERDLQTLAALQDDNGGFPIWRRGGEVWPYHSIHVAHALARARQKGYAVPEEMLSSSLDYLRNVEDHFPSWYGTGARRGLSAYALYVRKLLDDNDPAKARALLNEAGLENLSLESAGWLLFVLTDDPASQETVAEMRRFLNNRVTETAGAATVASGYSDGAYLLLHSSRRSDAVLLEALVVDQPDSDLITKLVRGLLGHRKAGRWGNTQENVWVLLALDRYFNAFESQTPDFVARIWLGEQYAGGHAFAGRSTANVNLDLPMQYVQDSATDAEGDLPLILQKEGQGRLYYRLGLRYAPADLRLEAADHGFTVERTYAAVDDPDDVWRDDDGVWHIRAGARVRVKLTMAAPARRVHVALVDPLPAGLEILNPELAVTGELPQEPERSGRWWWGPWYQHQNLRDERAEAFSSYLWAGVYEYSYVARATTPGVFVVPPAKAEEMYAPETFGRTGTDRVVVELREE